MDSVLFQLCWFDVITLISSDFVVNELLLWTHWQTFFFVHFAPSALAEDLDQVIR